jgi:transcriptional regulator with XRE-family HTH domain
VRVPDQGTSVGGRRLAAELRRLREAAGFTGEEAAQRLGWSGSKLSRIERHHIGVKQDDLRELPTGARRTTCSARTIASDAIFRTSGEDLMAFTDVFSRSRPAFPSRVPTRYPARNPMIVSISSLTT